jgi:hypothetical protein
MPLRWAGCKVGWDKPVQALCSSPLSLSRPQRSIIWLASSQLWAVRLAESHAPPSASVSPPAANPACCRRRLHSKSNAPWPSRQGGWSRANAAWLRLSLAFSHLLPLKIDPSIASRTPGQRLSEKPTPGRRSRFITRVSPAGPGTCFRRMSLPCSRTRNHPRIFVKRLSYYSDIIFGRWVRFFNSLLCFHISN